MKTISRDTLKEISPATWLVVPDDALFSLPERVLQFGTGALLRGLPDYFMDKANRQGMFNGRIVVVKSTDSGDAAAFSRQDNLYTLCIRGIENGTLTEENILSSAISRVLSAKNQWPAVLECARNPEIQIVLSNTTEAGIQLVEDDIKLSPPASYPGKLLAFLFERYMAFKGSKDRGLVIVPTELIPDNGKTLESIILELAYRNGLEDAFIDWIEKHNYFCNSLVDRIVPGKPDAQVKQQLEKQLGYQDELLTMSEVYRLWAIEGDEHIKSILSFAQADEGIKIEPSIDLYRQLKLYLLNGTHTLSCGLAFLAGIPTVKEAMQHPTASAFITNLMMHDLVPAIPCQAPEEKAQQFALSVLDRFRNPHIEHQWLSITLQYSYKMKMRIVPTLLNHYRTNTNVPEYFTLGFAAYLLFMKSVKKEGDKYWGEWNGAFYPINDPKAAYFYEKWNTLPVDELVTSVLQDLSLWDTDLSQLPGFARTLTQRLKDLLANGALVTLQNFVNNPVLEV